MTLLLENAVKVSFIVAAGLAAMPLFRHRSAALRHWVLSTAVVCAAIAPAFRPIAPPWSVQVNMPSAMSRAEQSEQAERAATASGPKNGGVSVAPLLAEGLDPRRVAAIAWLSGVVFSFLVLGVGLGRLIWLTARSERIVSGPWVDLTSALARSSGVDRPVRLLESQHPTLLVTWGVRRPDIIVPAGARLWSADRVRVVLLHELAHIRRGDWLTQLLAEGLRAFYWFNPLVWIASKRLRQESEHACDDAVLSGGVDAPDYATHLLDLARAIRDDRGPFFPAPAMARPSSLERRFTAMLNADTNRGPLTRPARFATTIGISLVSVLVAGFGAAQTFSTFSGSIFDSTNRVLPGVTLVLTNTRSRAKHEVQSDRSGRFEFVGLPPGDYTWETTLPGFASLNGRVTVAGRDIQRDLALQVGSLEETISIVGRAGEPPSAASPARRTIGDVDGVRKKVLAEAVCQNDPIGGQIRAPRKLTDVRPQYPGHLQSAGIGGTVVLDARIGTDGDVLEASVVQSADPALDAAAIEAVRLWQFTPTILNCNPVEVKMKVTANFQIRQ
jgi:TonB family protein